MTRFHALFALTAAFFLAGEAQAQGTLGAPLVLGSPFEPVPEVEGARPLHLATPKGPIPEAARIPYEDGGRGPVTLLAPWRGGWLVGTDAGEFEGALWLLLPTRRVALAHDNVLGAFSWGGRFYVLSGLRHMMSDDGELWEVDLDAERVVRRIPLPGQHDAVIVEGKTLIVRTRRGEVRLASDGTITAPGAR
jgi:hypothetical protein